jgi:hypothetical protein
MKLYKLLRIELNLHKLSSFNKQVQIFVEGH